MEALFQDAKHSIRMFLKHPAFTITALAALALGIGATTAVFSIVNTVLLKPLQIPDPDRLVSLATAPDTGISPAKFAHLRAESAVFDLVSVKLDGVVNHTGGNVPEQWHSTRASENLFQCFGIRIIEGRSFAPHDGAVAVISDQLWKRKFAADPQILGKEILLNGEPHTVIGIAGGVESMRGYGPTADVYMPLAFEQNTLEQGDLFDAFARLKPGITIAQARARLEQSTAEYRAKFPNALAPRQKFTVKPFRDDLVSGDRPLLAILSGAVTLVLLIACANVANLLLVRATGRRREIAIRAAVGASRGRMIRQLLTESGMLSLAGGAIGLALGYAGMRLLLAFNYAPLAMVGEHGEKVAIDWRVMTFALAVSLGTGIFFGLFPALQSSRVDLNTVLRDGAGASKKNRARAVLVVAEVGLAVVLLIGSALLIRSFATLYAVNPGFDVSNVITMNVMLAGPKFAKSKQTAETIRAGLERLRAIPGVETAGLTCCEPLSQGTFDMNFEIAGRGAGSVPGQDVGWATVSPGYFETLKIPLKRGRMPTDQDNSASAPMVWISERMAAQFWPDRNPIGERIIIGRGAGNAPFKDEPVRQIAGVVGDIRTEGLDTKPRAILYVPQAQLTDAENAFFARILPLAWMVRTRSDSAKLVSTIQEQLRLATGLPVTGVSPMHNDIVAQTGRQRFSMLLMTVFGGVALLLAAIGIYGLMAYTVEQRRHEIGIRMALGAEAGRVRNMVVRQGMGLASAGLIFGIFAAWGLTKSMASLLYGIHAHDPLAFMTVPVVLTAVALAAVYPAANRATQVSPSDSLRSK